MSCRGLFCVPRVENLTGMQAALHATANLAEALNTSYYGESLDSTP
jgi:hypothetical protein